MKMNLPDPQPTERKVPTQYRDLIKCEWQRRFTFWERIGILFGSTLLVQIGIATQHRTGKFQPLILGKVSKATTPDERHREIIENMIEQKPYLPVQQEPKS